MPDTIKPNNPNNAAQPQSQELSTQRSPNFLKIYSNAANIEVTAWDFNIVFGELRKADDKPFIEQFVAITMSPQHAKALAGVLASNVNEYEKHVGEIRLPQAQEAPSIPSSGNPSSPTQPKSPATVGFKPQ